MVVCLACAAPNPPIRCTGCSVARFCGRQCQKAVWKDHKHFCSSRTLSHFDAERLALEAVANIGTCPDYEAVLDDARVQVEVLNGLGIRDGGVVGQRPISAQELWNLITESNEALAYRLHGRNSFTSSFLDAVKELDLSKRWPLILSTRQMGNLTELPTLELCATVVWRVLSTARRLQKHGHKRLTFLGIGSGDALMEASIILHLATVLSSPVDLQSQPPIKIMDGDFEILFYATDTSDTAQRERNHTLEARTEMVVLPMDRRDAVQRFAETGPLYVFSCWMPMQAEWRADMEEDGGLRLAEICFVSAPPNLIQNRADEMRSKTRGTVELFPKTCSRFDFLARGFEDAWGLESGFHHSQVYILGDPSLPRPVLAAPLRHDMGSVHNRMALHDTFNAVSICRGFGLTHICAPDDLQVQIPDHLFMGLRQSLLNCSSQDYHAMEARIANALQFLSGTPHKQLSSLLT